MTPVVVIGAGPYGLSTTAHLRGRGLAVRTFGTPMSSWRDGMPAGMLLKSTPDASSMSAPAPGHTLADYCAEIGRPALGEHDSVPIELFVDYGMWFRSRLVDDLEETPVVSLDHDGGRFRLRLGSGEDVEAATVVVASGLTGFAHVPEELRGLDPALVSHSSRHHDLTPFAGRDVVVIGAGQSALEGAALLREAGASVRVLARRQVRWGGDPRQGKRFAPDTCLGPSWALYAFANLAPMFRFLPEGTRLDLVRRVLGPLGSWWLKDRVAGRLPVISGTRLTGARADGDKIVLTTGSGEITADHVMAATGYRVDLDALGFLAPGLRSRITRAGGFPRLDGSFQSSVPGLYFTGLAAAASFGPLLRFVCGTEFASPRLAAAVAARASG
ncbi:FAD-dependent oxidoreductase [Sphaerisporangium fuscum]|uniref:FAD-dependent oxidoreductase n=1 Tax=Sphaerisporangium fuscum TaxID=2835868 RepID=UPI001BDBE475|nr:FAD-dependent oxidoreductase [Sphaerisporangium fuscum]